MKYPSLNLPRDIYLSANDIRTVTSNHAFSSDIALLSNSENICFDSFPGAIYYLVKKAGENTLCSTMTTVDETTGNSLLETYAQYEDRSNHCFG